MKYTRWIFCISLLMLSTAVISGCSKNNNIAFSPEADELRYFEANDLSEVFSQSQKINDREYMHVEKAVEKIFEFSIDDTDRDSILENLLYIASRTRVFDSIGEQITTDYIYERLLEYGWLPSFHDFIVYRQSSDTTSHLSGHHSDFFISNPYGEILGNGRNVIAIGNNYDESKKLYIWWHITIPKVCISNI